MTVSHLILDLDNTLYPSTSDMERGITHRMMTAVADYFHISYDEAVELRNQKLPQYSTTLAWLRAEGLTDTEAYFAKVHPNNEADELPPDSNLRPLLLSIKQPKVILTNAPREHADRVLAKLGVSDLFVGICDIRSCNLNGKPSEGAYNAALQLCGGTLKDTLFIDDMLKYTNGYAMLGGTSVLVGDQSNHPLNKPLLGGKYAKQIEAAGGRTLHIKSIYSLPNLLQQMGT